MGKVDIWRYLLGLFIILLFWFILGAVPFGFLAFFVTIDSDPNTFVDLNSGFVSGINPLLSFFVINSSFWFLILGLFITVRFIHQRPFKSLITPFQSLDWRRLFQGFAVFFALVALASLIEYLVNPEIYELSLSWPRFLPFLFVMLLLIPIQTSAEELLFRGYLLQGLGHVSKNFVLLGVINGILFMLPHLTNPEVQSGPVLLALYYFGFGFFLSYITLKDNKMELALGAHAANNLFAGIFVNYTDSVLQTESVFLVTELNPAFGLGALVVGAVLFYFFMRPGFANQPKRMME